MALFALALLPTPTHASHSWGSYHWGRTSNPFTLKLGDNLAGSWKPYLGTTSYDWTLSSVLNTTVQASTKGADCAPTSGRVEVCNADYGATGWLGVAQIWAYADSHIAQGTAKQNDYYFSQPKYNTSAWKNLVMCQEVGHTFGLGHQDEVFDNANLGSCMDYTSDPDGTLKNQLNNEHPNQHDYDQLDKKIYRHRDSRNTYDTTTVALPADVANARLNTRAEWGRLVKGSADRGVGIYERTFPGGEKIVTFVIWADPGHAHP